MTRPTTAEGFVTGEGIDPGELLPLTALTLAVLMAVAEGAKHGYAIMKELESAGGPGLIAGAGSLYAALDRMLGEGLLEALTDEPGTRRRSFAVTSLGRRVMAAELRRLDAIVRLGRDCHLWAEGS